MYLTKFGHLQNTKFPITLDKQPLLLEMVKFGEEKTDCILGTK